MTLARSQHCLVFVPCSFRDDDVSLAFTHPYGGISFPAEPLKSWVNPEAEIHKPVKFDFRGCLAQTRV
ncbi:MAG: hypothetical protein AB4290_17345 [Spirulina sp.]